MVSSRRIFQIKSCIKSNVYPKPCHYGTEGRDSSGGTVTRSRAGLSGNWILVGARFFAPVRICPGTQPASYTMGTGSLTRVRRPGRGVNHPTPPSADVTETVEVHLYSPLGECDSVFISYSLLVCYMPHAYVPRLVGRMNYVRWVGT
jgi:hypothetical protein